MSGGDDKILEATGSPVSRAPGRESLFSYAEANELKDAGLLPWCGEWLDDGKRCTNHAEFILWGKLIAPEGLGPRCYDHAAKHIGHRGLTTPGKSGWAVADLRPLIRRAFTG